MRYFVILFLYCLLEQAVSRPQEATQAQDNYRDSEEAEYEDDEEPAAEELRENEDAAVDEKDSYNKDEEEAVQPRQTKHFFCRGHGEGRTLGDGRVTRENPTDNFSVNKKEKKIESREDETDSNDEDQPLVDNGHDRYTETKNDNNEFIEEENKERELRNQQLNKRRDSDDQSENNDMLYENSENKQKHGNKVDKNRRNFDTAEPAAQSRFQIHYYNRPPSKNRESAYNLDDDINRKDSNRDRRNADDPTDDGSNQNKKEFDNLENESEQAIIQRYIKKLDKNEVEELMNTLSNDKRALLEQIIENDGTDQVISLNKREITKKAGAVEENNLMDGIQSDSNKISGPFINLSAADAVSENNYVTGASAAVEDLSSTKVDNTNKIGKRSNEDGVDSGLEKTETTFITAYTSSTEPTTAKSENKREVNFNEFNNEVPHESSITDLQDESYAESQDKDLTQLMDDDAQLSYDYRNPQKRDLMSDPKVDMAEPMKSLQESFSNANAYEDSGYYDGSNMVPLVRVKRREGNSDHAVKKRDAAVLPESKVAYVPENEDEDNDEGNEFYDDGFFDHTANFAKSKSGAEGVSDSKRGNGKLNTEGNQSVFKRSNSLKNDLARDTMSIGSDTDSVLSGMEGVDENLMYSGGSRKKRAAEKSTELEPAEDLINRDMLTNPLRSTLADGSDKTDGNHGGLVLGYSDKEGFEPCDGKISRFKRIRRLKQRHSANKSQSTAVIHPVTGN